MKSSIYSGIFQMLESFIKEPDGTDKDDYFPPDAKGRQLTDGLRRLELDKREAKQQGQDADRLLAAASTMGLDSAVDAELSKRGRLALGPHGIEYTPSLYRPTEYRGAVCRMLALVITDRWRAERLMSGVGSFTTVLARSKARDAFGHGVASRWFTDSGAGK